MRYIRLIGLILLCILVLPTLAQDGDSLAVNLEQPDKDSDVLILIARGLDKLPDELFELSWFTALSLGNGSVWIPLDDYTMGADNTFFELPPQIANLQQLKILEITDANLDELPPEIGQLQNLESLILGDLRLVELPPEIGNLTNLKSLYLRGNQLSDLPTEITQLSHLESIDLGRNNLIEVPPELYKLPSLESIVINNNPIPQDEIDRLYRHLENDGTNIPTSLIIGGIGVLVCVLAFLVYRGGLSSKV